MLERYVGVEDPEFTELFKKMEIIKGWEEKQQLEKLKEDHELCKVLAGSIVNAIGVEDVAFLGFLSNVLASYSTDDIIRIGKSCSIVIPPKKSKKGKYHAISYIISRYNRPALRRNMTEYAKFIANRGVSDVINVSDTLEDDAKKSIRKYAMLMVAIVTKNEKYIEDTLAEINEEDWKYIDWKIIQIYNLTSHCINDKSGKDYAELLREANTAKKNNEQLSKQLSDLSKNAEQQLAEALTKIDSLEKELAVKNELLEIKNKQLNLWRQMYDTENPPLLKGMRVLVFGHPTRTRHYREVIEKYGGEFRFLTANVKGGPMPQIEGATSWADLVVYMGTYASHSVWRKIVACTPEHKLMPLTASGINTFEKDLLTLLEKRMLVHESSSSLSTT